MTLLEKVAHELNDGHNWESKKIQCSYCDKWHAENEFRPLIKFPTDKVCPDCIAQERGVLIAEGEIEDCGQCNGTGWNDREACHACWGKGYLLIDNRPSYLYRFVASNSSRGDHFFVRPELPRAPIGYRLLSITKNYINA